ncbi:Crp/Fnr family transcriptional regulator [Erythrobacter litoralis]|uniref:Crp/Fnr family transcriptional regulator n=1 Tax=Erythrobacter litoralis TaxID=39960 RepID=UPI002435D78D|nr:Crp/Fnr family transcriptional regulator [Erythrobacter litoralis]MDG6079707.1 Crp/Fnr family transcriptional regulator [Erythrobacter litoralis]
MIAFEEELRRYPNTGRFLAGRLRHSMSQDERLRLEDMVSAVVHHEAGDRIIARGNTCDNSTMLVEGFMVRTLESNGKRSIVSFHVPGDFVDLHCFALKRLDHNIDCIGPATVAQVPHDRIKATMADDPHLSRLLWFSTLLDAALHREWIMKLEQLTTPRRIAHIFSEIGCRLGMVGLGRPDGFDTPLTQSDVADMCGATAIHANRAFADLRRRDLLIFERGRVHIPDCAELHAYADFHPDYLYGEGDLALETEDA